MPTLSVERPIWTLDLGSGENRFHPDWMGEVEAVLDQVENSPEPAALITTATGKFYSNGLDLAGSVPTRTSTTPTSRGWSGSSPGC